MIMATFNRLASRTSLALLALALSPSVLAGAASPGSITFAPVGAAVAASSVPTLGTAALIFLALLLAFVAWVSMKKGGPTALSSISLALALVLGSSAGGLHWLQSAEAGNAGFFSIGSPSVA